MNIMCMLKAFLCIFLAVWEFASPSPSYKYKNLDTTIIPLELDANKLECVHYCLANVKNYGKILGCYKLCQDPPKDNADDPLKNNHFMRYNTTYDVGMICRDDRSVTVRVNVSDTNYPDAIVIQYKVSNGKEDAVYLSNNPFGLLDMLSSGTQYNVTGFGFKGDMYEISEQFQVRVMTFSTLATAEPIKEVKDIEVVNFRAAPNCPTCLNVDVKWTPTVDYICHYSVAWHDNYNGDLHEIPLIVELAIQPNYKITIGDLQFGSEYKVAVRSFMHFAEEPKNDFDWKTFVTPHCRDIYTKPLDILHMCPPLPPTNVVAKIDMIRDYMYNIQVNWDPPEHPKPHNYRVTISTLSANEPYSVTLPVDGDQTQVDFRDFHIKGLRFEVTVEAVYANGKQTCTVIEGNAPHPKYLHLKSTIIFILSIGALALLSIIIFCATLDRRGLPCPTFRMSSNLMRMAQTEVEGSPDMEMKRYRTVLVEESDDDDIPVGPYIDDSFEMDIAEVFICEKIGQGHFCTVSRGIICNSEKIQINVAVKKLKNSKSNEQIMRFVEEIKIMKSVPNHPNILGVIGHCTQKDSDLLLMTEFCAKGSLLNYLRNQWIIHRNKQTSWTEMGVVNCNQPDDEKLSGMKRVHNVNHSQAVSNLAYMEDVIDDFVIIDETHLTIKSLLDIALQVAEGMKFLGLNKVLHRDLAARNVLINENNVVKIADFGLSRDIYEEGLYKKRSNERVPIKWMALEALTHKIYTTESDVWSFGILLYEIITLGCIPYPTVANDNLYLYLLSGSRMEQPPNCSNKLYSLMVSCWSEHPNLRPSFEAIISKLNEEKNSLTGDDFVDLEKLGEDSTLLRDNSTGYLTPTDNPVPYFTLGYSSDEYSETGSKDE